MNRSLKQAIIAAAAFSLSATIASGADMAVKAPMLKAQPVADWSGVYVGGQIGWQQSSIGLSATNGGAVGSLTYNPTHSSWALGGFIGVQKQFNQFVLGVEGGYIAGFGTKSLGTTPSVSIFFPGGTGTGDAGLEGIWTIGARAGLAMGSWMPYLTGGYANGRFKFSEQSTGGTPFGTSVNANGGYYGVGLDYALSRNWIVGAEYRHYSFQSTAGTVNIGAPPDIVTFNPNTDTVVGRVSYKFGMP